ncbi:hypothetical protein ID866_7824 [Astraeus odoratus]|nr:hypothetical protein ID866_7824 [Astraeus odoratus]
MSMPPLQIPQPVETLSSDLSNALKQSTAGTLLTLIKQNRHTRYFSESPAFGDFHSAVRNVSEQGNGKITDDELLESYRCTVPFTNYDSYEPFVKKFLESNCHENDVRDMFSPGLPDYVAVSSSTTSAKTKYIARYGSPSLTSMYPKHKGIGMLCLVISFHYRQLIDVLDEKGETVKKIPVTLGSSGSMRMQTGLNLENDPINMKMAGDWNTSPFAVGFICKYRSFLLMNALFALADATLGEIYTLFTTGFVDMIQYMEEEWDVLVASIETGEIPAWEGTDHVQEHLKPHFSARPERASELRRIGRATKEPGWLVKIWPMLHTVVAIASGVFAVLLPKVLHYIGQSVNLRAPGIFTSEAAIGIAYDPRDLNLFKVMTEETIEYLDVDKEENILNLAFAWQVETGKNVVTWLAGAILTETHVKNAILTVQDVLGVVSEFTVVIDERKGKPAVGYLVEMQGTLSPKADEAPARLLAELCRLNEEFNCSFEAGRMGYPTTRVVQPGTFAEYRLWKLDATTFGSGQVKVPIMMWDSTARERLFERVERELGYNDLD